MAKPVRIQRKRAKGWRMPPNTVCVTRGTTWGNPFKVGVHGNAQRCVDLFETWFDPSVSAPGSPLYEFRVSCENKYGVDGWLGMQKAIVCKHYLRGKNLACWCKPEESCHADVLLKIANKEETP